MYSNIEEIICKIDNIEDKSFEIYVEELDEMFEINLFSKAEFEEAQFGYRVMEDGTNLIEKGEWKEPWYVIGYNELGDPIVLDVSDSKLTIFTIEHDTGNEEPIYLFTLKELLVIE
jgi:hypothetical protein